MVVKVRRSRASSRVRMRRVVEAEEVKRGRERRV